MVNFHTGPASGSAPQQKAVGVASSEVVAENYSRAGLVLVNLSDGTMYLGFGTNAAVVGAGMVILPFGGSWMMTEFSYTKEAVNAIAHSADSVLAVQEFVARA